MSTTFDTTILGFGNNTGIEVPAEQLAALGAGKRPAVLVEVGEYRYRSTVGSMGGRSLISLPKAHRQAAGLKAGDPVRVTLTLEEGRRDVEVPSELAEALSRAGLSEEFERLSYSKRKEFCRQVTEAKTDATRERRIIKVLETFG